ncbi:MAG: hypothetical protein KAI47_09080, partial [Deltaproteobacteria bacterium]|nr:hypothetical protein [Deltaproteobacteria bacterium]
ALANMALREPTSATTYLGVIDRIIDDTLRLERDKGMFYFLMSYARTHPFVDKPPRSIFIDGEIALMLGARRMIQEKAPYRDLFKARIAIMTERMERGPVACAESYPDECWMFCNTIALAAIKIADVLDHQDHAAFFARWIRTAKTHLIDAKTGILNSSFTLTGMTKDGPEGSSIWLSAHCLQLIDADLARDQYHRARHELGREILGFGYAREWPTSRQGPPDIDSGPIIPGLEASPGSSGLALLAAAAFGDEGFYAALSASLDFAAFPVRDHGTLRYAMSNQVGDAVVLYATVVGPLWRKIQRRAWP